MVLWSKEKLDLLSDIVKKRQHYFMNSLLDNKLTNTSIIDT